MNRQLLALGCLFTAVVGVAPIGRADDAPPTSMPATTQATASRDFEAIMKDVQATGQAIGQAMGSPATLGDKATRNAAAVNAIPPLQKMGGLLDELTRSGEQGQSIAQHIGPQVTQMLAIFGDEATLETLHAQAKGGGPAAAAANQDLAVVDWVHASPDEAAQGKLLDDVERQAKATPTDAAVTRQLVTMANLAPASPALHDRAMDVASNMQTPIADQLKSQRDANLSLHGVENKPLTIAGTTPDGKAFTTADWKGKIVLVDFWATWCGPCRAELPRVKKIYADYHAKGLEIVGVSNDQDAKTLTDFVAADPAMPWPQLFDKAAADAGQWNPITTNLGINGIPTMFLIDKKGVCRTVEARENMEDEIPKLLAE